MKYGQCIHYCTLAPISAGRRRAIWSISSNIIIQYTGRIVILHGNWMMKIDGQPNILMIYLNLEPNQLKLVPCKGYI